mgnify:CR=1 FL=1
MACHAQQILAGRHRPFLFFKPLFIFTFVARQVDAIQIIVKDEGLGIPEANHDVLFEAFERGTNVGQIKGTGLGLSIVKQAVDIHGGEINFISEVDLGTTFTITLPNTKSD